MGWNRHVTEFEDQGLATQGKSWETRHRDDVLAAAVRIPLTIATASYASELLLWKLETGQPYRWARLGTDGFSLSSNFAVNTVTRRT